MAHLRMHEFTFVNLFGLFFNKGPSLPAHMAAIRKQQDQPFDLTVWLRLEENFQSCLWNALLWQEHLNIVWTSCSVSLKVVSLFLSMLPCEMSLILDDNWKQFFPQQLHHQLCNLLCFIQINTSIRSLICLKQVWMTLKVLFSTLT